MLKIEQKMTFSELIRFTLPSMMTMVCMSMYTIIDGMFVSNLVGADALSAINIVYPMIGIIYAISIMFASGGNALVSKCLGEKNKQKATSVFSMIVVLNILLSVILFLGISLCLEDLCYLLGSNAHLIHYCKDYLFYIGIFFPACALQSLYQTFLVTASKPKLNMFLTVLAGVTNAILDYIFIAYFNLGIKGAALATGSGQLLMVILGTFAFLNKEEDLHFSRFKFDLKAILDSCFNGASEMVTNISASIITLMFNIILMKLVGESGVSAITIIFYGQFFFQAMYMGYSFGISPILGYHYGAKDLNEVHRVLNISYKFILSISILITCICIIGAPYMTQIFVRPGTSTYDLAIQGTRLFAFGYLFNGINMLASGAFTALSDGKHSAIISFMRTFVFISLSLIILPTFLDVFGVWISIPVAEALSLIISIYFLKTKLPI